MSLKILAGVLLLASPLSAANGEWALATSTLSYRVSHPQGETEAISHAAKGRGSCSNGQCNLRIEVLVKSFESGDSMQDLQMIQTMRGVHFPTVTVRASMPDWAVSSGGVRADLEIEFAGQTARYRDVPFQISTTAIGTRLSGTIPANLSDFKIDPPVRGRNQMPLKVELIWRPM